MWREILPLTANGKINKRALPAPEGADRRQGATFVPPQTVLEELLVNVWKELLKLDRLGIHDIFFEIGAHSLLASQVVNRVQKVLELSIPLRTIFEYPTVEQFAKEVDRQLTPIFKENAEFMKR